MKILEFKIDFGVFKKIIMELIWSSICVTLLVCFLGNTTGFKMFSALNVLKRKIYSVRDKTFSNPITSNYTLAVFSQQSLRIHDNPSLRYILSNQTLKQSKVVPVLLTKSDNSETNSIRSSNKDTISHEDMIDFKTLFFDTFKTNLLEINSFHDLDYISKKIRPITAVYSSSIPFQESVEHSSSVDIDMLLQKFDITEPLYTLYSKVYNEKSNVPMPVMSFDSLSFAQESDYSSLNLTSFLKNSSPNNVQKSVSKNSELEVITLLKDYINLEDKEFSRKYFERYVDQFSYQSAKFGLSLPRLGSSFLFKGEVFNAIIAPYLAKGYISTRLLYHANEVFKDAIKMNGDEKTTSFWDLKRFQAPSTATILREQAIRHDWHKQLASYHTESHSKGLDNHVWKKVGFRFWNGFIQREAQTFTASDNIEEKPFFIFIHGFGGSLDQFTGLARELSPYFHCVAIDSIGFGYSEKPVLSYNQYLWTDQVYDHIQTLYDRYYKNKKTKAIASSPMRVVVAGNSIGGFSAASLAARIKLESNPNEVCCEGLVLMNSAGRILGADDADFDDKGLLPDDNLFELYTGPSPGFLQLFGKAVFALLQPNIERLCRWLYPSNPDIVTEGLSKGIFRDSCDLGATDVLAAGGKII